MKTLLLLAIILFSTSIFSSQKEYISLKMDIAVYGEHISSPRLTLAIGETVTIEQETKKNKISIKVITTEKVMNNINGLQTNFKIDYKDENGQDFTSELGLFAVLGFESSMAILANEKDKEEELSIKILATKAK